MTALKNIPALIGGAAVLAAAAIGLTAGTAGAREYDNEDYWKCVTNGIDQYSCCINADGEWDAATKTCGPPGTAGPGTGVLTQVPPPPLSGPVVAATPPTVATNAPATTAPGSRAPGGLPSGGVAP